nr:ATP-binding cassette domain-containing protein [uncultured Ruminococcus sp.]
MNPAVPGVKEENVLKALPPKNEVYETALKVMPQIRRGELGIEAAKLANADGFITRLPDGYNTMLKGDGGNLSQGQRQLLSIARAVLADPKILILDEATSSVDTRTEMHIQSAMVALMKNRTSLIIAHRLSTIRDADKIVVIDGGQVVEEGSHEQLLAAKGCYYRLYQTQFSGVKT